MKKRVTLFLTHPLIGGSSVIFFGTFLGNVFNYLFNLAMGRYLTEADFGLMSAFNSLLILVGIFSVAFSNVITKFSAKYFGKEDNDASAEVLRLGLKFVLIFAGILFVILTFLIPVLGKFLHSDHYLYLFLVIVSIFFSLILSLPSGFIQGRLRFFLLAGTIISTPLLRLILALIIIFAGYGLLGPFLGLAFAVALPALILIYYVYRKYAGHHHDQKFDRKAFKKEFIHYTYTYLLSGVGITLLVNSDILLVRHFFSATQAGQYAALSLMGKAIFYFTAPIGTVFFPLIAYKREKKEKLVQTVLLATAAVVGASGFLSFIYFAFPQLILRIFFPKPGYAILSDYLGYYSLYILVFSVASLLNMYFLSIGKTKVYIITLIGAAVQIVSLSLFHDSLIEVIGGLFTASTVMLLLFLIYYYLHGEN